MPVVRRRSSFASFDLSFELSFDLLSRRGLGLQAALLIMDFCPSLLRMSAGLRGTLGTCSLLPISWLLGSPSTVTLPETEMRWILPSSTCEGDESSL